jgi:phospholipid/cholesterol/gamma-HCH transport system ATP-binding protein
MAEASTISAENDSPVIRIRDLVFRRGRKTILDGISMDIRRGSMVAFMGPSGAGKTTILRLISGQLRPDEGSIEINGRLISAMSDYELKIFRRDIGVLLQDGALFTDLTVFENIATPVRRRVAFARSVVLDPDIMLYDEPLTGLDPIAVSTIRRLMRETNTALGLTSLIVTHNVNQIRNLVDYCYIIASAKIAGEGPPEDLGTSPNPGVNQFMNGRVDGPIPFHYQKPGAPWGLLD